MRSRNSVTRTGCAVAGVLVAAVVVAGCSGTFTGGGTPAARALPSTSPTQPTYSGMVDIGEGRLYLECRGAGSPTVVFESGDESDTTEWRKVLPVVSRSTKACAYDRLGNGRSTPPTQDCRTLVHLRGDLESLLRTARIEPPYVLVGTSGGGYLVGGYALAHPEDVAGMVIADTFPAIDVGTLPPEVREEIACGHPSNQEHRDFATVEHEVWDHRRQIGDIPLTLVTNDYSDLVGASAEQRTSVERQAGWLVLSPRGRQVVVTTGHEVPENEPDLLSREILAVVDAARQG